jgi:hypothetical protein
MTRIISVGTVLGALATVALADPATAQTSGSGRARQPAPTAAAATTPPPATTTTAASTTTGQSTTSGSQPGQDVANLCFTPGSTPDAIHVRGNPTVRSDREWWLGGCLSGGAIVIPLKVQLTGNRDVVTSTTLAPFIGWQPDKRWNPFGAVLIGFAGLGADFATNNTTVTGAGGTSTSSTTSSYAAISYGFGILVPVGGLIQRGPTETTVAAAEKRGSTVPADQYSRATVGLVMGWDHTSSSARNPYNNKPWVGIKLGATF